LHVTRPNLAHIVVIFITNDGHVLDIVLVVITSPRQQPRHRPTPSSSSPTSSIITTVTTPTTTTTTAAATLFLFHINAQQCHKRHRSLISRLRSFRHDQQHGNDDDNTVGEQFGPNGTWRTQAKMCAVS
jgi:hypothetical protein